MLQRPGPVRGGHCVCACRELPSVTADANGSSGSEADVAALLVSRPLCPEIGHPPASRPAWAVPRAAMRPSPSRVPPGLVSPANTSPAGPISPLTKCSASRAKSNTSTKGSSGPFVWKMKPAVSRWRPPVTRSSSGTRGARKQKTLDMPPDGYKIMLCIEAANIEPVLSIGPPAPDTRSARVSLYVKRLAERCRTAGRCLPPLSR